MTIETIHLTHKAKDQLLKLKRATGIQNWNVLCRWGFCVSIADSSPLQPINLPAESAVEMTWKVFGGNHADIYDALLKERCHKDGESLDRQNLYAQFRLHLHRGIARLSDSLEKKCIDSMFHIVDKYRDDR